MKNKKIVYVAISVVVSAFVILGFIALSRNSEIAIPNIDSVTIQKDGNKLVVNADGTVRYETSEGVFEDFWSSDKTNAFFKHFEPNLTGESDLITGGQNYLTINSNGQSYTYVLGEDELVDIVEDETSGGGGGTGGGGGSGGGSSPTSTPAGGSGGGGGGGGLGDCLYWRLSYCVRPRTPTPSPTTTPVSVEIREPNCDVNTQTGRTVIGNDLCLPSPTPTPMQ